MGPGQTDGMVKFLADKETDRVLGTHVASNISPMSRLYLRCISPISPLYLPGIHIVAANAGEMIAEGVLAMECVVVTHPPLPPSPPALTHRLLGRYRASPNP